MDSRNILISGSGGLVGSALAPFLEAQGYRTTLLRRHAPADASQAWWDPDLNRIELNPVAPIHAVVHLAGETIAQRWSAAAKKRIRDSRVHGTRLLTQALAQLPHPPEVLLAASATGIYGDRGNEILTENSSPGTGFLADVAREWEAATAPASERGIRVVHLRLGVVLAPQGGALAKMLPVFRLGLGGRLGHGEQFWAWIVLEDLLRIILHCLNDKTIHGPINVVAPRPVTNAEFTRALARTLQRPAVLPVPAWAVQLRLGEMGRQALLASTCAIPARLNRMRFPFNWPSLDAALPELLRHHPN